MAARDSPHAPGPSPETTTHRHRAAPTVEGEATTAATEGEGIAGPLATEHERTQPANTIEADPNP